MSVLVCVRNDLHAPLALLYPEHSFTVGNARGHLKRCLCGTKADFNQVSFFGRRRVKHFPVATPSIAAEARRDDCDSDQIPAEDPIHARIPVICGQSGVVAAQLDNEWLGIAVGLKLSPNAHKHCLMLCHPSKRLTNKPLGNSPGVTFKHLCRTYLKRDGMKTRPIAQMDFGRRVISLLVHANSEGTFIHQQLLDHHLAKCPPLLPFAVLEMLLQWLCVKAEFSLRIQPGVSCYA